MATPARGQAMIIGNWVQAGRRSVVAFQQYPYFAHNVLHALGKVVQEVKLYNGSWFYQHWVHRTAASFMLQTVAISHTAAISFIPIWCRLFQHVYSAITDSWSTLHSSKFVLHSEVREDSSCHISSPRSFQYKYTHTRVKSPCYLLAVTTDETLAEMPWANPSSPHYP